MENNDPLIEIRSLLTELRETIAEYKKLWDKGKGEVKETFEQLLWVSKRLTFNIEQLYMQNQFLEGIVNILQRNLISSIADPNLKQNFQNELNDWKSKNEPQLKSFFNHLEKEK